VRGFNHLPDVDSVFLKISQDGGVASAASASRRVAKALNMSSIAACVLSSAVTPFFVIEVRELTTAP
jgi:hypothetical protein